MKRVRAIRIAWFAVALCLAMAMPAANALDSKKAAREKYDRSLKLVTANNLLIDWREFRLAAEVAGVARGFDWHPVRDEVMEQVASGDLDKALAGAQEIIRHNFANPEGHLLAMIVYRKMGREPDAAAERAIVDQIVQSITGSGDGQAAATAYFTVSVDEEYFFIGVVMGASPKSQAMVPDQGHYFDRMTVAGRDGKEQVVWFNTDTDMQNMASVFH